MRCLNQLRHHEPPHDTVKVYLCLAAGLFHCTFFHTVHCGWLFPEEEFNVSASNTLGKQWWLCAAYCVVRSVFKCCVYYFVLWPVNAQLSHKLSQFSYMFRHNRVILRQSVINTLPSYTSISNAAVMHFKYWCNLARYWLQAAWGWHNSVETCSSVIICEIIVHLLVIVQNNKRCTVHVLK